MAARDPHSTISQSKRLIGRRFSDKSVQDDMKWFAFTVDDLRRVSMAG